MRACVLAWVCVCVRAGACACIGDSKSRIFDKRFTSDVGEQKEKKKRKEKMKHILHQKSKHIKIKLLRKCSMFDNDEHKRSYALTGVLDHHVNVSVAEHFVPMFFMFCLTLGRYEDPHHQGMRNCGHHWVLGNTGKRNLHC